MTALYNREVKKLLIEALVAIDLVTLSSTLSIESKGNIVRRL